MSRPFPVLLMARELNLGGTERQMAEIAKALDRSRFDPRVGCFRPAGMRADDLRAAGVPIVHFPVPSMIGVKGAIRIAGYIRREGIRLVHTFDTPANIYAAPSSRMAGSTVVLSSQRVDRTLWAPIQQHALRVTDRLVDGIVVNCEFLRRHLRDDEQVDNGLIRLCYNGIDTSVFYPRRARTEALRDASLVLGVVCALRPEKGLKTLLDAFAAVGRLIPGMKLAIVGSGPCAESLQQRAKELEISRDCIFEPATARVPEWLNAIDIFVLPSVSEALSNSLMEAMACGCCVVASRVGGNPELVADEKTGRLFEPGDSAGLAAVLRCLIVDPSKRKEMACRSAGLIRENFSIGAAARRMGEIYAGFLGA